MMNRMSGVTLRRPLIVLPPWKISLSSILVFQLRGHVFLGETK
jgi:hypothetical protein